MHWSIPGFSTVAGLIVLGHSSRQALQRHLEGGVGRQAVCTSRGRQRPLPKKLDGVIKLLLSDLILPQLIRNSRV